jgi:ribosomal protein S18 acetylase RimI-like enzyme
MDIRPLALTDRDVLIALHTASWTATYGAVFSADYVETGLQGDIAEGWQNWPPSKFVIGAFEGDALVGFATYLMDQSPCYLDNFHIATSHHGQGVAQVLFTQGAIHIARLGATALKLTVLDSNARARAFYTKMGGLEGSEFDDEMLDHKVTAIPVSWADLDQVKKNAF